MSSKKTPVAHMSKKRDQEFGSQANLVRNAAGMASEARLSRTGSVKGGLSRTASRTSEFETVS